MRSMCVQRGGGVAKWHLDTDRSKCSWTWAGHGIDTDARLKFQELILPKSLNLYIGPQGSVLYW